MKQFYAEYIYWEDYINGMYEIPKNTDEKLVLLAIELLSNKELFLNICIEVVKNWVISSKVNLTNKNCNRKAWLGQASCSFKYKIPEIYTRIAWNRLTEIQQIEANKIAEKVINNFETNYESKNKKLYI